jgi:hypothetical protein
MGGIIAILNMPSLYLIASALGRMLLIVDVLLAMTGGVIGRCGAFLSDVQVSISKAVRPKINKAGDLNVLKNDGR